MEIGRPQKEVHVEPLSIPVPQRQDQPATPAPPVHVPVRDLLNAQALRSQMLSVYNLISNRPIWTPPPPQPPVGPTVNLPTWNQVRAVRANRWQLQQTRKGYSVLGGVEQSDADWAKILRSMVYLTKEEEGKEEEEADRLTMKTLTTYNRKRMGLVTFP